MLGVVTFGLAHGGHLAYQLTRLRVAIALKSKLLRFTYRFWPNLEALDARLSTLCTNHCILLLSLKVRACPAQ